MAPTGFADLYFDATRLLLARLEQTARNVKGSLVIDRLALARAVRHTRHFPGVTCSIALDPATGFRIDDQAALARCATLNHPAGRRRRSRTTEREKATMKDDTASPVRRLRALPRPRPATAIALLALVMAMGGTSIAGSVINGSALTNGSVTRHKIATNAIDSTRLAGNAVTTGKIARARSARASWRRAR